MSLIRFYTCDRCNPEGIRIPLVSSEMNQEMRRLIDGRAYTQTLAESGWTVLDEKHYCPRCSPKVFTQNFTPPAN